MQFKLINWFFNSLVNFLALFSGNNEQRRVSVVANFVFDSEPIGNEIIRVFSGNSMYNGKVGENGAASVTLSGGRDVEVTFGDTLQFSKKIFIPDHREVFSSAFLIGTMEKQFEFSS